jgi:hypothetical protein
LELAHGATQKISEPRSCSRENVVKFSLHSQMRARDILKESLDECSKRWAIEVLKAHGVNMPQGRV